MQINPNTGFFDVQPGEVITITVAAINTRYVASFPPSPSCTMWSSIQGPANGRETRTFVAPASGDCFVVIVFDFQPDAAGVLAPDAKYQVNVSGSNGGSFNDLDVNPPPPVARNYRFHVI